jgi:hypothetical protein
LRAADAGREAASATAAATMRWRPVTTSTVPGGALFQT